MNPLCRLIDIDKGLPKGWTPMLTPIVFIVFMLVLFAFWCSLGCATTPRPVPCESPPVKVCCFPCCMTGPGPWLLHWAQVGVRFYPARDVIPHRMPVACKAFDVDHDGDVDLRDWGQHQNAVK